MGKEWLIQLEINKINIDRNISYRSLSTFSETIIQYASHCHEKIILSAVLRGSDAFNNDCFRALSVEYSILKKNRKKTVINIYELRSC